MEIFHNPRCSKSRQALSLLNEKGINPDIVLYLETPPSEDELRDIISKLNIRPEELVRKGEADYKEKFGSKTFSGEEWIRILSENPRLIERPIFINGDKAVIGRPPERIFDIL